MTTITRLDTPWGPAQTITELAPGVRIVTTASHGGLQIEEPQWLELPAAVRRTFTRLHPKGWAEEDCEMAIALVLLGLAEHPYFGGPDSKVRRAAIGIANFFETYHPCREPLAAFKPIAGGSGAEACAHRHVLSLRCPDCGQTMHRTIAEVVRCHPCRQADGLGHARVTQVERTEEAWDEQLRQQASAPVLAVAREHYASPAQTPYHCEELAAREQELYHCTTRELEQICLDLDIPIRTPEGWSIPTEPAYVAHNEQRIHLAQARERAYLEYYKTTVGGPPIAGGSGEIDTMRITFTPSCSCGATSPGFDRQDEARLWALHHIEERHLNDPEPEPLHEYQIHVRETVIMDRCYGVRAANEEQAKDNNQADWEWLNESEVDTTATQVTEVRHLSGAGCAGCTAEQKPIAGGSGEEQPIVPCVAPTDSDDETELLHEFTVDANDTIISDRVYSVFAHSEDDIRQELGEWDCSSQGDETLLSRELTSIDHYPPGCRACQEAQMLQPIGGGAVRNPKLKWTARGRGGSREFRALPYVIFHPYDESRMGAGGGGGIPVSDQWRLHVEGEPVRYSRKDGWSGKSETLGTFTMLAAAKARAQAHADARSIEHQQLNEQLGLKPIAGGSSEGDSPFVQCWPIAEYFAALPEEALRQQIGTYSPGKNFKPCCVGAHLAFFLGTELLTRNLLAPYHDFLDGEKALAEQLNLDPHTVSTLLYAAGADTNPFGYRQWPVPPAQVFTNLLTIEKIPRSHEAGPMHSAAIDAYKQSQALKPIAGGSGEEEPIPGCEWCDPDPDPDSPNPPDAIASGAQRLEEAKNALSDVFHVMDEHALDNKREPWLHQLWDARQTIDCIQENAPGWEEPTIKPIAGGSGEEEPPRLTTRERKERRLKRRLDWAESREHKAEQTRKAADAAVAGIPFGQPILVGHHSEKRHRRAIDRHDRNFLKTGEHLHMADRHRRRAAGIQEQLNRSIYSDDDDAIPALQQRIAELEARRTRMKAINQWLTKHGGIPRRRVPRGSERALFEKAGEAIKRCHAELTLTQKEGQEIVQALQFNGVLGYPSYALSNLSANIRRQVKRLERLQKEAPDA